MDRIQRALDLSRRQRSVPALGGLSLEERPELLREDADVGPLPVAPIHEAPVARLVIDRRKLAARRVVLADDQGPASRAYRMLRAQVLQAVRGKGYRAIGIVSAVAGEGKTLTAINLAMSLAAEPNHDVTLVDLDLRKPSVARLLGVAPPKGIDAWIADGSPASDIVYGLEGVHRLELVPTLAPVSASSEALASERLRELLVRLRARHPSPVLILDQPPALLSDDVLTVAPQLDAYILVVTEHRTKREDVTRVFELLGRERLIGTVLNRSADSEQRAY
jgi:Mrp family chromosome partitioning ATPase